MPAPSNTSFTNATDLGTLPASVSQNVHDSGTTYTVYYKLTAPTGAKVVSVFGFGDLTTYKPSTSVYHGALPTPPSWLNIAGGQNVPIQFPVDEGEVYYLKFTKNGTNPNPAQLTITAQVAPDASSFPDGAIVVNDDTVGLPLAVLSASA